MTKRRHRKQRPFDGADQRGKVNEKFADFPTELKGPRKFGGAGFTVTSRLEEYQGRFRRRRRRGLEQDVQDIQDGFGRLA